MDSARSTKKIGFIGGFQHMRFAQDFENNNLISRFGDDFQENLAYKKVNFHDLLIYSLFMYRFQSYSISE